MIYKLRERETYDVYVLFLHLSQQNKVSPAPINAANTMKIPPKTFPAVLYVGEDE